MRGKTLPYWPVITHPLLRRVLPAMAISSFGDGMSVVAISWLALQLAPAGSRGAWVGFALAAYELPAALGALVLGRFVRGRGSVEMVYLNAAVRGTMLGLIPIAYWSGFLTPVLFIVLLGASSLLAAWGSAGQFSLIAKVLPPELLMPANAIVSIFSETSTIAAPPVAGLIIAAAGAPLVIALDAASFLTLSLSFLLIRRRETREENETTSGTQSGRNAILRDRTLVGLVGLTFFYFLFFGPVYVALPLHVTNDLHGSAALLGLFWTAFGVGSLPGAFAAGFAGRLPLWRATVATVVAFGVTLLPIGLGAPTPIALIGLAVGGFIWGPYIALTRALFQRRTAPGLLPAVLAANSAVLVVAAPLGMVLGGPLTAALGPKDTMLAVGVATIALGVAAAVFLRPKDPEPTEAELSLR